MKKRSQFLYIIFFLVIQGISLVKATEHTNRESWIISKTVESSLEDIQVKDLVSSLKDFGISAKIEPFDEHLLAYALLKGKYFTLYLAPRFYQENQVWIMSHPELSTPFENLTSEQLSELEEFRYLMGEVYRKALGYQGYVMFMDLTKDYSLGHPSLCLEMIPASLGGKNKDLLDIREKIERSSYFLFRTAPLKQLSPDDAKTKIKKLTPFIWDLLSNGETLTNQKRIAKNTLPWSRKITHMEGLQEKILLALKEELFKRYSLLTSQGTSDEKLKSENTKGTDEGEFTQEKVASIDKCAFCNPEVIQNQTVYKQDDFVVLYNFRPYTEGYHFMITPYLPLHVEDWQNFSHEDVMNINRLAQALVREIKKESGRDDVILFVQNGMAAGMTVPHGHMHVLLRPSKLHLASQVLLEISQHKRKGLTSEEMDPVKKKFNKKLSQS
ncbi:MAG: HIT family protein [Alphaproteobacteria bacterium]|nr:HIT family protein [Alphaproteobacteria bacterium]